MSQDLNSLPWRKSTYSATGTDCVELAPIGDAIAIRNSHNPHDGTLVVTAPAFSQLLDSIKAGDEIPS